MLTQLPHPTIFAHRGSSAYAPENTVAAFDLAYRQGADAIELDAKLTVDGHVVVIHDQTVDRTTGASGRISELSLAELRELDVGSYFDVSFQGERIPTLDEVFEVIGQQIYINVELTNYASIFDALPDNVAKLVQKHNLSKRVLFSSFNPFALIRIRRILPETSIALLALPGKRGALARSWVGNLLSYQALHTKYSDVDTDLLVKTHSRMCQLNAYTVNQEEDIRHLISIGIDGIITDDPALARRVLDELDMDLEDSTPPICTSSISHPAIEA